MAQHYEVKEGETLAIPGPANVIVKTGMQPVVGEAQPPELSALEPDTAVCGGPDLQLVITGTGFNEASRIVFNGFDEPTALLSPTQVRTNVKPSLFAVAAVLPVTVRNGSAASNALDFTFTEGAAQRRR